MAVDKCCSPLSTKFSLAELILNSIPKRNIRICCNLEGRGGGLPDFMNQPPPLNGNKLGLPYIKIWFSATGNKLDRQGITSCIYYNAFNFLSFLYILNILVLTFCIRHIYIYTFQRDTQCSSTDCLLILRCQLYIFRTVTVHPQELLFRCCMCRLWYVLIRPAGTTF